MRARAGSTEHSMLLQWSRVWLYAFMYKLAVHLQADVPFRPIFMRGSSRSEWLLSYLCSNRSPRNNGRGKGQWAYMTHCFRSGPQKHRETYNTSVDKQSSLSASTEKTEPCPTLVKVYIIGQTSMLEDNEQCWEKLCHSGPGWQRHTNTQRTSSTLAPSSTVSSVLQRHYCCSGSTLSRQCCLFCGPWHRSARLPRLAGF